MSDIVKVKVTVAGRLSYPSIYEPRAFGDEDKKEYSACIILDPETKAGKKSIKTMEKAIKQISEKAFGGKIPSSRVCLKDGSDQSSTGYEGKMFVRASNKFRPTIVNNKVRVVASEDEENAPYAGCYVKAVLVLWSQDNRFGKRVNASLEGVQFIAHGERFGGTGGIDATAEFEEVDVDGDGDEVPF